MHGNLALFSFISQSFRGKLWRRIAATLRIETKNPWHGRRNETTHNEKSGDTISRKSTSLALRLSIGRIKRAIFSPVTLASNVRQLLMPDLLRFWRQKSAVNTVKSLQPPCTLRKSAGRSALVSQMFLCVKLASFSNAITNLLDLFPRASRFPATIQESIICIFDNASFSFFLSFSHDTVL